MKWRERLLLVAIAVAAVALWFPWVDHKAAALVLTGLDLPEFVRFMGEYRSGALRVVPLAFAAPIVLAAVAGCAYAAMVRLSFWGRVVTVLVCLWLLTVPFPPLEKGRHLVIAVIVAVVAYAGLSMTKAPPASLTFALAPVVVLATGLPLWQFAVMLPALNGLYGRPVTLGAGVYLEAAAALAGLVLCGVCLRDLMMMRRRSSGPAAHPA